MRNALGLVFGVVGLMAIGPVQAAGLLGGLLNGDNGVADVQSGPAGSNSLVNVGIGGGGSNSGNVLDVKLGGNQDLLSGGASLGTGGSSGTSLSAGLGLNLDGLDLGLGGTGGSGGNGGNGGNGGSGGGTVILVGTGGGGGGFGSPGQCSLDMGQQVLQLAANGKVSRGVIAGWQQAANVQVVPVKLCATTRQQVARILGASSKVQLLQGAAAADVLISASLSRTRYDAGDVFAIERRGDSLTVYVF